MNSLEALLAILSLLCFIGILITGISSFKYELENKKDYFLASDKANSCMLVVDSLFSNSGKEFRESFDCFAEKEKVKSVEKNISKEREIITEIKKEKFLEVRINEHYLQ
jgi:hypothetical protein